MMDLKALMEAGDDLMETRVIPGSPDWQALHDETPEDTEPDEDDDPVTAAADDSAEMMRLLEEMEERMKGGEVIDDQAVADLLGAAWIRQAGSAE